MDKLFYMVELGSIYVGGRDSLVTLVDWDSVLCLFGKRDMVEIGQLKMMKNGGGCGLNGLV